MERVQTKMKELEDNLSTYNGTMDTFYTRALNKIETIKGFITRIRSDIAQYQRIQKEYSDSQVRVATLQNQIEELGTQIQRLQQANDDLRQGQNANEQLRNQLAQLQEDYQSLIKEKADLQRDLGIANRGNENKDTVIQDYRRQIEAKDHEIAKKQNELEANASNLENMRGQLERARIELDEERGRESGLEEQMNAYGDRIERLNNILIELSSDHRTEEVQEGLDYIIGQLTELTNNSGSDGPGGQGGPDNSIRSSSSAPGSQPDSEPGTQPDSEPEPQPEPEPESGPGVGPDSGSRPGTADSQFEQLNLKRLGDNIGTGSSEEGTKKSAQNEQKHTSVQQPDTTRHPRHPRQLQPINPVKGYDMNNKEIIIPFSPDVNQTDRNARKKAIEKIVNDVFRDMRITKDQMITSNNKVDYPHTIRMKADINISTERKIEMRKKVRENLMNWQNEYTNSQNKKQPFKDFYLQPTEYDIETGNHDPFEVEFPFFDSTQYKIPMTRGGKTKGKKTRRKKEGKSKNKTIRYKHRKNRKQSKK